MAFGVWMPRFRISPNMFNFLNTLEILPVAQVEFIAETLRESGLDAAVMIKAKVGMPGFISVNAWTATAHPLCQTIATELVCCADNREELRAVLLEFCEAIHAAAPGRSELSATETASGRFSAESRLDLRLHERPFDGAL